MKYPLRVIQRQLALLNDADLNALGLVRQARVQELINAEGSLLKSGHVYVDCKHKGELVRTLDLGQNTLSYPFRVMVAKLLARTATKVQANIGSATFPNGKDGFISTDAVFPVRLYIGTGATPALPTDSRLDYYLTSTDTAGAPPLFYDLKYVIIQDTKAEYDALFEPINVAFEFEIPDGTLRSGADAETTPYIINEFGLSDYTQGAAGHPIVGAPATVGDPQVTAGSPPVQLARKVAPVIKLWEMSLIVRWEIRT